MVIRKLIIGALDFWSTTYTRWHVGLQRPEVIKTTGGDADLFCIATTRPANRIISAAIRLRWMFLILMAVTASSGISIFLGLHPKLDHLSITVEPLSGRHSPDSLSGRRRYDDVLDLRTRMRFEPGMKAGGSSQFSILQHWKTLYLLQIFCQLANSEGLMR